MIGMTADLLRSVAASLLFWRSHLFFHETLGLVTQWHGLEPKGLLLLSILPWNRPHEAQKARAPEPSKSPEQLALIVYAFFPLRETFYVSTWASDHARSLF